jgi:uncharacterized protein YndB with AHSA1/START domain
MTTIGTMRALDQKRGAVRVEELYDTDIRDLWEACTSPERLARWLAQVSGDLRVGGTLEMTFTSTWTGPARVEVCDAPHHLLLTSEPGIEDEAQLEAWFAEEGSQTRLVVEERGLPVDKLHFHGAGWQVHLEDLGRSLRLDGSMHPDGWSATQASPNWRSRWVELTPDCEVMPVDRAPVRRLLTAHDRLGDCRSRHSGRARCYSRHLAHCSGQRIEQPLDGLSFLAQQKEVDVLGEPLHQPIGLRKARASLEQELSLEALDQGAERRRDPVVLLDLSFGGAKSGRRFDHGVLKVS